MDGNVVWKEVNKHNFQNKWNMNQFVIMIDLFSSYLINRGASEWNDLNVVLCRENDFALHTARPDKSIVGMNCNNSYAPTWMWRNISACVIVNNRDVFKVHSRSNRYNSALCSVVDALNAPGFSKSVPCNKERSVKRAEKPRKVIVFGHCIERESNVVPLGLRATGLKDDSNESGNDVPPWNGL